MTSHLSPQDQTNLRRKWLFLLVVPPLLWAGNALAGRAMVGVMTPVELAFWRWVLALLLILPFTGRDLLRSLPILRANWKAVVALSLTSVAAYNTLLYAAVQTTSAVNATLVGTSMPLMILIVARFWLGDKIRMLQLAGIAVSFLGLMVVIARGDFSALMRLEFHLGDGLMLLATLSWAFYSVMLRKFPLAIKGLTLLTALMVIGVVLLSVPYAFIAIQKPPVMPSWSMGLAIVYTAIFASLVAYYFWNRGVQVVGASVAGQYTYLIPLFTALLGVPLFGEELAWFHGIGAILIFAGIGLATKKAT